MAEGLSSSARAFCSVNITGMAAPASGEIQMGAEAKHAARLRIKHNQVTGCIRSNVSCGFYRRKPVSQGIGDFAVTVLAPNLQAQRKASQREDVPGGNGHPQQAGTISGIRRLEPCALRTIPSELEYAAVGRVPHIDRAVVTGHGSKRMRGLLRGIGQNPPNLQE